MSHHNCNQEVNLADGLAAALLARGATVCGYMDFLIAGSPVIANALLRFALRDNRAYQCFMDAGSAAELRRLPLSIDSAIEDQALVECATQIQMLLMHAHEEVRDLVTGSSRRGPNEETKLT